MRKFVKTSAAIFCLSILFIQSCGDSQDDIDPCASGGPKIEVIEVLDEVESVSNGRIKVTGSGGSGNLLFSIDGQNFQSGSIFSDLPAGAYTITVKDESGCLNSITEAVNLVQAVSFSLDILPILQANCMIATCHCDGNSFCFDTYEIVSANAEGIRKRTTDRNMPPSYSGKMLTDDQIEKIANWVIQGILDN